MTEWDARAYHDKSRPHVAWGATVLERLSLRGDEIALDAGCGTGKLTAELLRRLPQGKVIALDRSQNMMDQARDFLGGEFSERVSFVKTDLLEIDLDREVDVIFSTATFHWVLDHPRLFRNLFRALRPGGSSHRAVWRRAKSGKFLQTNRIHTGNGALCASFHRLGRPVLFCRSGHHQYPA